MKNLFMTSRRGWARLLVLVTVTLLILAAVIAGYWWWRTRHAPVLPPLPPPKLPAVTMATGTVHLATPTYPVPVSTSTTPVSVAVPGPWPEPAVVNATREAGGHVYAGLPRAIRAESEYQLLKNGAFWVGYSSMRQNPLWAAYRLGPEEKGIPAGRVSYFKPDSRTLNPVKTGDFASTGFDRGHLAPNSGIATRYGEEGQLETFVMSNVCPQRPKLNQRVWETIERLEDDKWGNTLGEVFVIAGPIFDEQRTFLPSKKRGDIEIPDRFFKVIVDEEATDARMLAFIVPQEVVGTEKPEQFLTTVDEVEKQSGLDLFPALSDERENRLEAQQATVLFPVR